MADNVGDVRYIRGNVVNFDDEKVIVITWCHECEGFTVGVFA